MAFNKLSLQDKLLTKTVRVGECLVWNGQKSRGYGHIVIAGKKRRAHIVHYELHYGPVPKGKVLLHSCDNPACIELTHLSPGTQMENVEDMLAKGRASKARGEKAAHSKLTVEQVLEIRGRYKRGERGSGAYVLAKEYGVSKASIQAIVRGESWTHI